MKKNKKGTDAVTSMPHTTDKSMAVQQIDSNTDSYICLLLFIAFLILFLYGYCIDNEPLTFFGLGLGVAVSIITMTKNIREDE